MTLSGTTTEVSYAGDGAVTVFTVTFPFLGTGSTSELEVVERIIATGAETTQTYSTDYTVTGGSGSTGTVTAATAPASAVEWHIRRITTRTQGTDYVENDEFPANSHEDALDRLTMIAQETIRDLGDSFQYPDSYTGGASTIMPEPVANSYLLWNADADALTTSTTSAAQFLGSNGTVSLPFYSFSDDPDSGVYRIGANNVGIGVAATKILDVATAGLSITGTTTSSGILSIDDTTETSSGTTGSIHTDGGVGIAKKLHVIGTTTHGGNVVSDTDSTDDLGTTGVRWANLFVDDITATAAITAGGVITGATLEATGDTSASDNAAIGYTASEGLILTGQGSSYDITLKNDADGTIFGVPTGETSILFPDNAKAEFGTGRDLQIYHSGSHSYINDSGVGNLYLAGDNLALTSAGTSESYLQAVKDGAVTLYYDNTAALATASAAVNVTGDLTATLTIQPGGDTSAGDAAAIGYTAGEGLILTGQGSTSDITVKNDADGTVFTVQQGQMIFCSLTPQRQCGVIVVIYKFTMMVMVLLRATSVFIYDLLRCMYKMLMVQKPLLDF